MRLSGVETIDDDASTHACTPKIILAGEAQKVVGLNPVTYAGASTPVLKDMSSRFASVLGQDSLIFNLDPASGSGGIAGGETVVVSIDNRPCAVSRDRKSVV